MRKTIRTYSRFTLEALKILGNLISIERKKRRMTATDLSKRCGITRQTLSKIEKGEPTVEIGTAFEAAAIVGVPLFQIDDPRKLHLRLYRTNEQKALLPKKVRNAKAIKPNDEF